MRAAESAKALQSARKPSRVYQMCIRAWRVLQLVSQPSGQIRPCSDVCDADPRGPEAANAGPNWSVVSSRRSNDRMWSRFIRFPFWDVSIVGVSVVGRYFGGRSVNRPWLYDPLNYVTGIRPFWCPWHFCRVCFPSCIGVVRIWFVEVF